MHVQVGHLEAGDEQARPRCVERRSDGLPDGAGDVHDLVPDLTVDVLPLIHLLARYDQDVALGDRRDGEECDDVVVLPHETSG